MQWFYSEQLFEASFRDSKSGSNSWAGVALGPASFDRIIVVATCDMAGTDISSVTVAGIAATRRVNSDHAQIWTATVPTGTTGTITVVSSSGTLNGIGVYSLYGLSSEVPVDTDAGSSSASVDVNSGGFVIASFAANTPAGTPTWTGLTRDWFAAVGGSANFSTASDLFATAQTVAISETGVGGTNWMAAASWGPT
jgi:hypothetical protein